ncbi:molybdenum cofactor biosynthesis protein MoaE [Francisellaceae bacterium]|nr:molybdenum cofactor biosynthesis protein MoaE [Francisellaceae bacterium]
MGQYFCETKTSVIDTKDAVSYIGQPEHGASLHFLGVVRSFNEGKKVKGIDYEVCNPLATNILNQIAEQTLEKFPQANIYISHFEGYLDVGEVSLLVSVSTPHRDECYKANRFIVEAIKHKCPVWKKEYYEDKSVSWVKGCTIKHEHLV